VILASCLLDVDLIAHDSDVEAVSAFRLPQDCQGYLRAFFAADHLYNVAQVHVDDVNGLSLFLGHAMILSFGFSRPRALGASPPGINSSMTVKPLSLLRAAPIPSRESCV